MAKKANKAKQDTDKLSGIVESYGELLCVEMIRRDDGSVSVYHDGDLDDGVDTNEDILERYGDTCWPSLAAYKGGPKKGKSISKWLDLK